MEKNCRGQLAKWKEGYGFINFNGRELFVHRDAYLPGFKSEIGQVGQMLAFDLGPSQNSSKPPMAVNVRVVVSAKTYTAEQQIRRGIEALIKLAKQDGAHGS
jgi:cold shock CspA family protein